MKVVIVSGYFDPIHEGHLALIENAKKLGDKLVVIIGSQDQLIGKKGFFLVPVTTRYKVMESIKGVDLPSLALDKDGTVCETLRHIHDNYYDIKSGRDTMIFANGGDRTDDNIPEKKVCEELGIEMIFGVGGGKINNSSSIIQDGFERYTKTHSEERPWGFWKIINQGPGFKVKMLVVDPGKSLSVQRHKHRSEHWIVVGGRATVHLDEMVADLVEGESWYIPKKEWHQLVNNTTEILNVVEVSTGDYLKEDDIERKESWNVKE